ncbi:MAG TPA: cellulase family glycosylhydrolase [Ktedonobacterales bacterium]|nr:cellulase family glycosylhydrolase [Ktedonobacterales bacterium]
MVLVVTSCAASTASVTQRTSQVTPIAATATPTAITDPNGVHVQGTQLYHQGRAIALIGFNRTSLEYSCTGDEHLKLADFQAMRAWGANVVRLPTSSEFWANAGGACPTYRATVQRVVASARAAHLFVILDLQWSAPFDLPGDRTRGGVQCPMPDAGKDAAMWQDIARLYSNDTGVLFDLYGEPFGISWSTWLNGGRVTEGCYIIGGPSARREAGTYQAIGMRPLVKLIREIAPDNVIIVSGTNWGFDLSGIPSGFAIPDKNIVYDTHPFDYGGKQRGDWSRAFGQTSAQYPVIAGEFGSYSCGTSYIRQAIDYFNARHISWLAWSWQTGPCSGPSLLADWAGAPSAPYGSYIKQRMLAVAASQGA